ncbi:MAG: T9SS type A sorting domain-containing protein [Flavobacteriales bacterium]|nr:T9SS type A sorting domain-containing protein [Flavobacteriales bacterium]
MYHSFDCHANWINNLLCQVYKNCRAPLTGGEEGLSHTKSRKFTELKAVDVQLFYTAPNPAENWVTFNYKLESTPDKAFVLVLDATGRRIAQLPINQVQGQLVMDTRALAKGVYTVYYSNAGANMHQDKLIVQ